MTLAGQLVRVILFEKVRNQGLLTPLSLVYNVTDERATDGFGWQVSSKSIG